jgi:glycogen operon protein
MSDEDWQAGFAKSMMVFLNGEAIESPGPLGERVLDDTFLLLFNASEGDLDFQLPQETFGRRWVKVVDTAQPLLGISLDEHDSKSVLRLTSRSMMLLRRIA